MPIRPPSLDDRRFDDLVEELLARVPAHTPEWTHPRVGDPGRTLIELFAWLTDTLLYRVNLIPERQRLAFLRLLGVQMRAAQPARSVVSVLIDDDDATSAVTIKAPAIVTGTVNFETRTEVTLLPVSAEAYSKRPPATREIENLPDVIEGLREIYRLQPGETASPYITTPVFPDDTPELGGFDIMTRTVDKALWLALLAAKPEHVTAVRDTLGSNESGGQRLLSVGIMPAIAVPELFEEIGARARIPHLWEITSVDAEGQTRYHELDLITDSTAGLTQRGVQRLALPAARFIGAPSNDVREALDAGVGDTPPRLDDSDKAARLVAWLRLRPRQPDTLPLQHLSLSWVGINAVEIDQRQTITGRIVGQSSGLSGQEIRLPGQSVDPDSLAIQVEESGVGYQRWIATDDLTLTGRDDRVYHLNSEAGVVTFGNGVHGYIPPTGSRVRVATMRSGGGEAGNLPAGSLTKISAYDLHDTPVAKLKVVQPLPTDAGEDAETLAEAEERIPALLRHGNRAVTEADYKCLAADTPGIRMGRVEVLPRFKPQQRRQGVPGVVSVMVLPAKAEIAPPNPRPDRPFLEFVHGYLDTRRPLSTELYVIGTEYIPLGVSVSVAIANGFGHEEVLLAVREALYRLLWPLPPGGPQGEGWRLGRRVSDRELEVSVARVAGVIGVNGLRLFEKQGEQWRLIPRRQPNAPIEIPMLQWQLPELLSVVVVAGDGTGIDNTPETLDGVPNPFVTGIAVPVVPEVCR